jgi:hypothetical protein
LFGKKSLFCSKKKIIKQLKNETKVKKQNDEIAGKSPQ